jgi:hypothetical protein
VKNVVGKAPLDGGDKGNGKPHGKDHKHGDQRFSFVCVDVIFHNTPLGGSSAPSTILKKAPLVKCGKKERKPKKGKCID